MRSGDAPGRRLTAREHAVVAAILAPDAPGFAELRGQLGGATVTAPWSPGAPHVDLAVPEDAPASVIANGPLPIRAEVVDVDGGYLGEVLIWISSGRLAAVEYAWVTDEPPTELPDPARLRLSDPE